MRAVIHQPLTGQGGIKVHVRNGLQTQATSRWIHSWFERHNLSLCPGLAHGSDSSGDFVRFQIPDEVASLWAPGGNTTQLSRRLKLDLEQEILLAMLLSPIPFEFPSERELAAAIRIRSSIVQAARRTALAFATYEAERPPEYWRYDEERGFLLRPGKSLITALEKATHTNGSDRLYTFSCRRATEYLLLLGLTREARTCNTRLYEQLHHQAETRALKGTEFERVFVRTIGSPLAPLPVQYFVPGDRTWFRNTDPSSAEVTGYEGSWTFYLGGGLFADFWRRDRVFTLESKLACIYHWRHATFLDAAGELQIDEAIVDRLTEESCRLRGGLEQILHETLRLQTPLGTDGGGCIEPHREHPCLVCPETTDVVLPDTV